MKSAESIRLQDKDLSYTRQSVPVHQIQLDPKNPRIQYLIKQRGDGLTQAELIELIWTKDPVKALASSIYQNGGVYEPLILQGNGDGYIAREGNCRTVACRHLCEQYPDDNRFTTVPAMVFDASLTDEDLAVLLASMHVAGKIRWDAYEQAKHVSDLVLKYGKTYDWLSNHLRLSKSKIVELLTAYKAATEYLAVNPAPENVRKFSFFQELAKKKELKERFEYEPSFKQQFQNWLKTEKLTDAKQVRDLPLILENAEAVKSLDKSGFLEARKVLTRNDPSLESDLFYAIKDTTERLKNAPAKEITDLKVNKHKLLMLRNLKRAAEDLGTLAGVEL
jgi:hypothetical protein